MKNLNDWLILIGGAILIGSLAPTPSAAFILGLAWGILYAHFES